MRELLNYGKIGFSYGIAAGISIGFGMWLWNEVLEEKVEDLKDRLTKND